MPTVNVHITATEEDGYEPVGTGLQTGVIFAGESLGTDLIAFFRFLAVTGPVSGATINSATLTVNVTSVTGIPNTLCYGVDVDDAAQFADPSNLPSAASKTTASSAGPTATGSQAINVATQVQEIVNRAGWSSGNDMAFIIDDNQTGDNRWAAEDFEDGGAAEAYLDIDYTNPGGGSPAPSDIPYTLSHNVRVLRRTRVVGF